MGEIELFDVDVVRVNNLLWELPDAWCELKPLTWDRLVHIDSGLWEFGEEIVGAGTFYERATAITIILKYNSTAMTCSVRAAARDLLRQTGSRKHEQLFLQAVHSLLSVFPVTG